MFRDITLSAVTVLDLVLEDAFQATPFEDVFTLVQANDSGGGYGLHGEFIDAGGNMITHGSVLKASTFFEEFEFLAEYTADNRFTLTVIPEPGALGLLGGALAVLLAARMNRRRPNA